ncbi:MAG: MBL fold metallo-hydrolase [Promethearchaeota archaeon]
MVKLESVTTHTVADTSLLKINRSANVGGISLENYSIAIDSSSAYETGKAFRQQLEAFFNLPVRYLFLTHTHTDHRNGLNAFKDVTLIANQKCIKNMPKNVKLKNFTIKSFDKQFLIEDNDLRVEFHYVGGHTIGSSVAYFPHEKVLFGGDLFFTGGVNFNLPFLKFYQNKSYNSLGKKSGNPDEYINAFEKFNSMDIEIIVPGHGDVVFTPKELLNTQLIFFKSLRVFFIAAIEEKKGLKDIELPKLELINQAFARIEELPPNKKHRDKVWLDNYLNILKTCFYDYYKNETKS